VDNLALSQFLSLFSWFAIAALLFFLLLIARFFQKFSGEQTRYVLFGVVIIIFGISTVRYTSLHRVSGDMIADVLSFVGGILLLVITAQLYRKMMRSKNQANRN